MSSHTKEEDSILVKYYPNFEHIKIHLPNRGVVSCRTWASRLGIRSTDYLWTEGEVKFLKKNYGTATWKEMAEHLPGRTIQSIKGKARKLRLFREPNERAPVGVYVLDEIRARAKELNFSLRDLDEEAGCRRYFQDHRASRMPLMLRIAAINAAVKAMGGKVVIQWCDEA